MTNNKQIDSQNLPLHSKSAHKSVSGLLPSLKETIDVNTRNIDKSKHLITFTIFILIQLKINFK